MMVVLKGSIREARWSLGIRLNVLPIAKTALRDLLLVSSAIANVLLGEHLQDNV